MDKHLIAAHALAWADDELVLGHRNSEWTGHAPILEEDIAFANIALDELGHAQLWYGLVQELTGENPDQLVFFRDAAEYRCCQLVELPKGDWAVTIVRQYLFDALERVRLPHLAASRDPRVAEIAAKIRPEEAYHYRHTSNWVTRLGLGTSESHSRMQAALDCLWPYALQLFVPAPGQRELEAAGIIPAMDALEEEWRQLTIPFLQQAGLVIPAASKPAALARTEHTPHLAELLGEMQQVARSEPFGVEW